jgi:hypothetical protein
MPTWRVSYWKWTEEAQFMLVYATHTYFYQKYVPNKKHLDYKSQPRMFRYHLYYNFRFILKSNMKITIEK